MLPKSVSLLLLKKKNGIVAMFMNRSAPYLSRWLWRGHPPGRGRWHAPSSRHLRALLSVCRRCSFGGLGCCSRRVCVCRCRGCCSLSVCVCVWPVDVFTWTGAQRVWTTAPSWLATRALGPRNPSGIWLANLPGQQSEMRWASLALDRGSSSSGAESSGRNTLTTYGAWR